MQWLRKPAWQKDSACARHWACGGWVQQESHCPKMAGRQQQDHHQPPALSTGCAEDLGRALRSSQALCFRCHRVFRRFFPHGMEWIVACFFSLPASCILTTVPLKVSYLSTKVFSQNFTPGELLSGVFKQWAGDVCFPPFHHGTPSYTHQNSSYMTWS